MIATGAMGEIATSKGEIGAIMVGVGIGETVVGVAIADTHMVDVTIDGTIAAGGIIALAMTAGGMAALATTAGGPIDLETTIGGMVAPATTDGPTDQEIAAVGTIGRGIDRGTIGGTIDRRHDARLRARVFKNLSGSERGPDQYQYCPSRSLPLRSNIETRPNFETRRGR